MKRFLVAAAYGLGGLVLAGTVSVAAFAVTGHQLSDPTEPISIGRTSSVEPVGGGDVGGSAGAAQSSQHGDGWTPSWSPSPSPAGGGDDHSSGSGSVSGSGGSDDSSGSGSDASGSGSGSDDPSGSGGDDSSGSGEDGSGGGGSDDD